jgi:head-tail adaptor
MARNLLDAVSLNPGALKHAIKVEGLSKSGNQWEDTTPQWTTICSTRASIEELGGFAPKEVESVGQLSSFSTHLVSVRYTATSANIIPGHRVNFGGRLFRIQIVQNVEFRNRVIRLFVVDLTTNVNN